MTKDDRYIFTQEQKQGFESLFLPLGAYQFINNKVVTLLVSEGLCELVGMTREMLMEHYNMNMFGNVHPDDVEMLANLGYRFATKEGPYDITYRTKLYGKEEYRYVHAVGKFNSMEDGSRIAFLMYADITNSQQQLVEVAQELNTPKVKFFDENMGAMVVVSRREKRLLYFNKAVCRMLPSKVNYDSGMTFQQYFYSDIVHGIKGLFEAVDIGPRVIEEPYTHRNLEINVISSTWNNEPAYVVYFYEYLSGNIALDDENELRHKRVAFNNIMFSGKSNNLSYFESGYKGFRVWNLTRDEVVLEGGSNILRERYGMDITFNDYCSRAKMNCVGEGDREFLALYTKEHLILLYESGTYPRNKIITLQTEQGRISVSLEITMMKSPDNGELYIKIWEENITDEIIVDTLITKTVEQEYDYIAYIDILANKCRIIYGKTSNESQRNFTIKINDSITSASYLRSLYQLFGSDINNIEEIMQHLIELCGDSGEFTKVYELPNGNIKSIFVHMIDKSHKICYIRCTDVTDLLIGQRKREKELEQAKNDALIANQHLQKAVQAERDNVEKVLVQTVLSISNALDARDEYTCRHSERVAQYAAEIARRVGWVEERVQNLYNIALVHDIGKIGIPDALLLKKEILTADEYEQIKKHVEMGGNILKDFTAIDKVSEGALYHHERYDGKGYGRGLRGEEIPIEARIIGIADSVDAMNSTRPYREKQNMDYIIGELKKGRETQFDPELVDIMLEMIEDEIIV